MCSCYSVTLLNRRNIDGCSFKVEGWCICTLAIFTPIPPLCVSLQRWYTILAYTKVAELASLQVYLSLRPLLLWLLTMVTICDMSADFGRWMVHLSWEVPGSAAQRASFVTYSPRCSCLRTRRAKAASTGRGMTQSQYQSCQSKLQGSRTKGGSHVACNFLEAIKPTPFNSLSNTHAILTVKWSFRAQLPIQSWKTVWMCECEKHFAEQCWTHLLISLAKRECNGGHVHSVRVLWRFAGRQVTGYCAWRI